MRALNILLLLTCAAFSASAQSTNLNLTGTNSLSVSLQDAIQRALEHDLALQGDRLSPLIARAQLSGAYAGWDPVAAASGAHSFSRSGGGIDPSTKLPLPSSTTDANNFNASLNGLLPLGLNYNLSGNIG